MKKIIVAICLIILCLAFCGCATVRYSVVIADYGARTYTFDVTFDQSTELGSKEMTSVGTCFSYMETVNPHSKFTVDQNNPRRYLLTITYESQEDYYDWLGITGDEESDPLTPEGKGFFVNYVQDLFGSVDFLSYLLTYSKFYKEVDLKQYFEQNISELSAYVDCSTLLSADDFNQALLRLLQESEYADRIAKFTLNAYKQDGYDFDSVAFYLDYSHSYSSVQGIEPDETSTVTTDTGEQTMYTWRFDPLVDSPIKIKQISPNVWLWELIGILGGVTVGVVCFVLFLLSRSRQKRRLATEKATANDLSRPSEKGDFFDEPNFDDEPSTDVDSGESDTNEKDDNNSSDLFND